VWAFVGPRGRGTSRLTRRDGGTAPLIIVSIVVAIALGRTAAGSVPTLAIPGPRWVPFVLGLLLVWIGIGLALWAARTLGRFYRPVVAIDKHHEVVTAGPYRYVRHPLYAGSMLVMTGVGIALGNWLSLIVCVLMPLAAYVVRIRVEEAALEDALGDRYLTYEQGKARLVPGIW
jgi:protein-S-isoprenylcysteine O-methyltransferase Ste14